MSNSITLDYTNRDFDGIRAQLVGVAKGLMPEWSTVGEAGDFGTLLLELYAYAADAMHYYIDRVGAEAFLGTARRRQSVLFMANMLGYRPIGQQAASVVLAVSLDPSSPSGLSIPAATRVTNAAGTVVFELDYDVTISPGETKAVTATEGVTTQVTVGVSKGAPNAEFVLPDQGVIFHTITLQTREGGRVVEWTEVQNTVLARPTQNAFSTYVDDEGSTHILFGDNAAGRVPPTGCEIVASYRYGVGAAANSLAPGSITVVQGGGSFPGFSIKNLDRPLGGADQESVDAMRFSIPRATAVQQRAVTLADYTSLALQVPGVAKAKSSGQVYSAVTIRIAPVGGGVIQSDQASAELKMANYRSAVASYLSDKVLLGSHVFVEDVYQHDNQGWEDIIIDMDVYVLPGYNRGLTVDAVQGKIEQLLSFDAVDFGMRVSIGSVHRAAESVNGVDYVDLKVLHGSTGTGQVSHVVTPDNKLPRIRPKVLDDDDVTVIVPYGLTLTGFGGLVNT